MELIVRLVPAWLVRPRCGSAPRVGRGRSCSRANVAFVAGDLNNVRVNKGDETRGAKRYLAYFEKLRSIKALKG